jgi:hypothetical protein
MKTLKKIVKDVQDNGFNYLPSLFVLCVIIAACSKSEENDVIPKPTESGTVSGCVLDDTGNPYPSTLIRLKKGSNEIERATNASGIFTINTNDIGTYTVEIELPLATKIIGTPPTTVNVLPTKQLL